MLVGACLPACGAPSAACNLNWFKPPCICMTTEAVTGTQTPQQQPAQTKTS